MTAEHDNEVRSLLPWAANGSLTPEEQAEVDALLRKDAAAAEDLAFLRRLAAEVKADAPASVVSDLGWQRLKRRLDTPAAAPAQTHAREEPSPGWRRMAIAAMLLVAVQAGWLWQMHADNRALEYRPMSGTAPAQTGAQLRLMFAPDATAEAISGLLRELGASIVSGPSALGLYDVRVATTDPAELARLAHKLSDSPLIRHQEQLDAP